jgi:hypothetical protein
MHAEMLGKLVINARQTPEAIKYKALYPTPPPKNTLLRDSIFQTPLPSKVKK